MIDGKFFSAACWSLAAAALALVGLTQAYELSGNELDFLFLLGQPSQSSIAYRACAVAIGYLLFALAFFAFGVYHRNKQDHPSVEH